MKKERIIKNKVTFYYERDKKYTFFTIETHFGYISTPKIPLCTLLMPIKG